MHGFLGGSVTLDDQVGGNELPSQKEASSTVFASSHYLPQLELVSERHWSVGFCIVYFIPQYYCPCFLFIVAFWLQWVLLGLRMQNCCLHIVTFLFLLSEF